MNLEKIDSINVNILDIIDIYKFLKKGINWDTTYFRNYVKEVNGENEDWIVIKIKPEFLLLPDYRYSPFPEELKRVGNIKGDDEYDKVINFENLSRYNVFKVENGRGSGKSEVKDIWFWMEADCYRKRMALLSDIGLIVDFNGYDRYIGVSIGISYWNEDVQRLEVFLKTLRWARGRRYSYFANNERGVVAPRMEAIENGLWALLNFLYIIFAGGYKKDKFTRILEPMTEMLKEFGNTFEEAVATMKVVAAFIG